MSRPDRYPDFFDPIFDAVPPPPDPDRGFRQWFNAQKAECFPALLPESAGAGGVGFRFTARGAPLLQVVRATIEEVEEAFSHKTREYWEANVRQ